MLEGQGFVAAVNAKNSKYALPRVLRLFVFKRIDMNRSFTIIHAVLSD